MSALPDRRIDRLRCARLCVAVVAVAASAYFFAAAMLKTATGAILLVDVPFVSERCMFTAFLVLFACMIWSVYDVVCMHEWKPSDKWAWSLLLFLCALVSVPVFAVWNALAGNRMPVRLPFFTVLALMVVVAFVGLVIDSTMSTK